MPEMILLVGLPGSGKTTYRHKHYPQYTHISSDDLVERNAASMGISYAEAYKLPVYAEVNEMLTSALARGDDIVVDFVNAHLKPRRKFIEPAVEAGYTLRAVVFSLTDAEHQRRIAARTAAGGKTIPKEAIDSFAQNFTPPTKEEGFASIKYIRD